MPAYRYGIVLLLLFATFVFLAIGPTGDWVPLVAVVLQGATLLAALSASGSSRRLWRIAVIVVVISLGSATVGLIVGDKNLTGSLFLLNLLLVAGAPVAIVVALARRHVIDIQTVLGAVCVYVLLGMLWSFAYAAIGTIQSEPFFTQQAHATVADYLYFSFVTQTTVGYGDFTAAGGFGRALAVLEALIGQLYLVTVIALLVSNLGPARRRRARRGGGDPSAPRTRADHVDAPGAVVELVARRSSSVDRGSRFARQKDRGRQADEADDRQHDHRGAVRVGRETRHENRAGDGGAERRAEVRDAPRQSADLALEVLREADCTTLTEGVSITPTPSPMSRSPGANAHTLGELATMARKIPIPPIVTTKPAMISVRCSYFAGEPPSRERRDQDADGGGREDRPPSRSRCSRERPADRRRR